MLKTYRGLPLKEIDDPIVKDIRQHKVLGRYLESLLWPIGEAKIVGSFKKYVSYKDIDVTVTTEIKTKGTIIRFIQDIVLSSWYNVSGVPVDFFVYGDFSNEVIKGKKYTIYFNRSGGHAWNYVKISTRRFMQYLLKI